MYARALHFGYFFMPKQEKTQTKREREGEGRRKEQICSLFSANRLKWNKFFDTKAETLWNVRDRECTHAEPNIQTRAHNMEPTVVFGQNHMYSFIGFLYIFFFIFHFCLRFSFVLAADFLFVRSPSRSVIQSVWIVVAERNVVVRFVSRVEHISSSP